MPIDLSISRYEIIACFTAVIKRNPSWTTVYINHSSSGTDQYVVKHFHLFFRNNVQISVSLLMSAKSPKMLVKISLGPF